jgi:hypothetical protein
MGAVENGGLKDSDPAPEVLRERDHGEPTNVRQVHLRVAADVSSR